jgi:hypothetical protein
MGLTVVPSYVLGGNGQVTHNKRVNVALIGCGTQAANQMLGAGRFLSRDELQFVTVCDPNRESNDYPRWGRASGETEGMIGGREAGRRWVNEAYAARTGNSSYNACTAYADFREMFEKERLDAVIIITPDHLHTTIALAAMKKNIHVACQKPISNFMYETRLACNASKTAGVNTHLFAYRMSENFLRTKAWIDGGLIGKVTKVYRWNNRPVWPQGSPYLPEPERIPFGFDWQLWLGPSEDRPYSRHYTHTVFRGWYEFGAGCLADMGLYGFWQDWRLLNLGMPVMAEGLPNVNVEIKDYRSYQFRNTVGWPYASNMYWGDVPVNGKNETIEVMWSDGGIRPQTPKELVRLGRTMPVEGVIIYGERGAILGGTNYQDPVLLGVRDGERAAARIRVPEGFTDATVEMIQAFQGVKNSAGNFANAQTVCEAVCLGNLSIRMANRLEWDNQQMRVTNLPEANEFLTRKYRPGWEL